MTLHPLHFKPILKERIWGGTKLHTVLGKDISSETTGESWELSAVDGDISIVDSGAFAGKSLSHLIDEFPDEILGSEIHKRFGKQFPLLFKFLDAREDLSIQVHPNDSLAEKRHNSFGKTEMWYVMQADEGSRIIVGFNHDVSREEYVKHLENNTLPEILNSVSVKPGDVFFLETGTIHALGGGVLIAEIQQTSDITYRVFDWNRVDSEGNSRQLHTEEALDAINYDVVDAVRNFERIANVINPVIDCPYFTTGFLPLDGELAVAAAGKSFSVLMCVDGDFSILANGADYQFKKGDTVLLPAVLKDYTLRGKASLLEIHIS